MQKKFRKICDLRGLSAAIWDEDTCTITLDDEHYNNHIKVWMLFTFSCSHNMSTWKDACFVSSAAAAAAYNCIVNHIISIR